MQIDKKKHRSYGAAPRSRVRNFLAVLLHVAHQHESIDESALNRLENRGFSVRWPDKWATDATLEVYGTIELFTAITEYDQDIDSLSKENIRDSLYYLESYLGRLKHHQKRRSGLVSYHFSLELWSRDTETNLQQLEYEWERKRPWNTRLNDFPGGADNIIALQEKLLKKDSSVSEIVWAESPYYEQGQSVLSLLLKDSPVLLSQFDIQLHATLGQNPSMSSVVKGWIQVLGGEVLRPDEPLSNLWQLLVHLLQQQKVLIVLDDVWDKSLLQPLIQNESQTRVLAVRQNKSTMLNEPGKEKEENLETCVSGNGNIVVGYANESKIHSKIVTVQSVGGNLTL